MRKKAIKSLVVTLIAAMVVALMPLTASAATKKPGKVTGLKVTTTAVSTSTNMYTVTLKWKKASNAKGYVVYAKHGSGGWVKQKKLNGKSSTKLKIKKVPAGQVAFKVRAVNKKKYGKYSKVKSLYKKSPLTAQQYVDRVEPSMKGMKNGVMFSYTGNTMIVEYDLGGIELTQEQKDSLQSSVVSNAELKNTAVNSKNYFKNSCGIANTKVLIRYTNFGETVAYVTY